MATTPQFAATPESRRAQCTSAYTDRTGAASGLVDLVTAAANGTKITQIVAKAAGNSVACQVLIFITDTSGSNPRLFDEIALSAASASTTVQSARSAVTYDDLQLKAGQKLQVGVTVLSGSVPINVIAQIGDF